MEYLTFNNYVEMGGTLDNTAFNRCITRATAIIKTATHCRIDGMQTVPVEVKALCFDMVQLLSYNPPNSSILSGRSQSAGGVSESESYTVLSFDDKQMMIQALLYDYLGSICDDKGTPLLYRGCRE